MRMCSEYLRHKFDFSMKECVSWTQYIKNDFSRIKKKNHFFMMVFTGMAI